MRRSVAQFLEQRLDPSALLVDEVEVALAPQDGEVRDLLRAGLVGAVIDRGGRLLGQVPSRELLGAGYVELARRWVEAAGPEVAEASPPVRRALRGERPVPAELAAVRSSDLALALLAYRAAGALTLEDVALFAGLARRSAATGAAPSLQPADPGLAFLRELLERPLTIFWPPLSDEPPAAVDAGAPTTDLVALYLSTGDLAGCLRLLEAEQARAGAPDSAEAGGAASAHRQRLATARRLLTGDGAARS